MNQNNKTKTDKNFSKAGAASMSVFESKTAVMLGDKAVSATKISPNCIISPCYDPMSSLMIFPIGFLFWLFMKIITFFKKN